MGVDAYGEWDGICACGRAELNGVKCYLGASHQPLNRPALPWAIPSIPSPTPTLPEPLLPLPATNSRALPWSGATETEAPSSTPLKLPF